MTDARGRWGALDSVTMLVSGARSTETGMASATIANALSVWELRGRVDDARRHLPLLADLLWYDLRQQLGVGWWCSWQLRGIRDVPASSPCDEIVLLLLPVLLRDFLWYTCGKLDVRRRCSQRLHEI